MPGEFLALMGDGCAGIAGDAPHMQLYAAFGIEMGKAEEPVGRMHFDAEFFAELAPERRRLRLAAFELATGEFPVTRERLARRAFRSQHPANPIAEHCSNNLDGVHV